MAAVEGCSAVAVVRVGSRTASVLEADSGSGWSTVMGARLPSSSIYADPDLVCCCEIEGEEGRVRIRMKRIIMKRIIMERIRMKRIRRGYRIKKKGRKKSRKRKERGRTDGERRRERRI